MTTFGTLQIGRMNLVEIPKYPATDSAGPSQIYGRNLAVAGQESVPSWVGTSVAQLNARSDDLNGSTYSFVPVTFSDKADRDGYYTINDTTATLTNWEGEMISLSWTAVLLKVGTPLEIDLESRLTGAATRNTSFPASAATGYRSHTPPVGAYGYWTGSTEPSAVLRPSSDGTITTYLNLPIVSTSRWGCSLADYPLGRCRFLDSNGLERSGLGFSVGNTGVWTLQNSLVQASSPPASGGMIQISSWTSGAWQPKTWDIQFNGTALGTPASVSVLRNEYEMGVVRLLWDTAPGRITADLTVKRGDRNLQMYIQSEVSGTIKVVRHTAEGGSSAVTGYVTAAANDTAGNRYIVGSAHTFTADTTNGGISAAASTGMDVFVGVLAGGSAAIVGDRAADLYSQYLGSPAEMVSGVRR